jgi:hypothetical protein
MPHGYTVDEDEVTKLNLGGLQGECNFLTENGVYEVLMQSRKPIDKNEKNYLINMEKKIPIYEARVRAIDDTGIFAMSFVDYPANETDFVALSKQIPVKLSINKQKQLLTGVVLIPEQLIYRNDNTKGEYYLKFSAEEIEKIALKMMKTGIALRTTTHQHEKQLSGNYLAELWIVKDPKKDKAAALGLGELPAGTLMASYKIENVKYWNEEVMTGNVKGFSLEGFFNQIKVNMKKETKTVEQFLQERRSTAAPKADKKEKGFPAFLRSIATYLEGDTATEADNVADVAKKDETGSGTPFLIYELGEGGEVWVDSTGFCTKDDEQMPAGEHALTDGNFLVVDDAGQMVVTEPEASSEEPASASVPSDSELKAAKERGKQVMKAQAIAAAKERGKQVMSAANPNSGKIAALEAEIAKLKATPSAPPAKPSVEGATEATCYDKTKGIADVIRMRNEKKQPLK